MKKKIVIAAMSIVLVLCVFTVAVAQQPTQTAQTASPTSTSPNPAPAKQTVPAIQAGDIVEFDGGTLAWVGGISDNIDGRGMLCLAVCRLPGANIFPPSLTHEHWLVGDVKVVYHKGDEVWVRAVERMFGSKPSS